MSERLTKALEFANYRLTLNNQLVSLRSKLQTKLIENLNFKILNKLFHLCQA